MIRSMTAYARREIKGEWGAQPGNVLGKTSVIWKLTFVCRSSSVALNLSFASVFVLADAR